MTTNFADKSFCRFAAVVPAVIVSALLLSASGSVYAGVPVYVDFEGTAIEGYDPVAYFTEGRPMKGSEQYTHKWLGATWHFANAKHRDMFAADPIKYAPQYGGFCSRGTYAGKIFTGNPNAWRIIDGKLYLFYSERTLAKFDKDSAGQKGQIEKANENWPKLKAEHKLQPK